MGVITKSATFDEIPSSAHGMTLIAVGDSIANLGASNNSSANFIVLANLLSSFRFELVNAGVSSDTTTQILARFGTDVLSQSGDIVFYGGTNDPSNGIPAETTIANIKSMIASSINSGRKFIYCTIMPTSVTDNADADGTARRVHTNTVNNWARQYATTVGDFYIADTESVMTDPATGTPLANYTDDGVHPNGASAIQLARPLAELLADIYPDRDTGIWNINDPKNLIGSIVSLGNGDNADGVNGFNLTTGVTGTGPNGWVCNRRNTGTGVTSGDVARTIPEWATSPYGRMVASFAAAGDGAGFHIGGSDIEVEGRWDGAWAASTAYTYGDKRRANTGWVQDGLYDDYIYVAMSDGTTAAGGSEPDWATHQTEGEIFTDNTVTWMTVKKPVEGDELVGECELQLSAITGAVSFRVELVFQFSSSQSSAVAVNYDLTGDPNTMPDYWPENIRFRTPPLTVPELTSTIRYVILKVTAYGMGTGGNTVTMDVSRAKIYVKD